MSTVNRLGGQLGPHLLMSQAEGFLAPVPIQLQDADQVTNRSDDRQTEDRLDPHARFQAGTSWKSFILRKKMGKDFNSAREME